MARRHDESWEAYVERVKREAFHVEPPPIPGPVNAWAEADRVIAARERRRDRDERHRLSRQKETPTDWGEVARDAATDFKARYGGPSLLEGQA